MFHYKYYNNNIGIYLIQNDYDALKNFLKKYNYNNIINDNMELLNYDIAINYDPVKDQVTGTAFSDYF